MVLPSPFPPPMLPAGPLGPPGPPMPASSVMIAPPTAPIGPPVGPMADPMLGPGGLPGPMGPPLGPDPMMGPMGAMGSPGLAGPPDPDAAQRFAVELAGFSDDQLRGWLWRLTQEEGFALIQALAAAGNPALFGRIARLTRPERERPPRPPKGFKPPAKPEWGEVQQFADAQLARFEGLRQRIFRDLAIYEGKLTGVFRADKENPDTEAFWSSALRADTDLGIASLAAAPVRYRHRARTPTVRRQSQECEDTVRWLHDANNRRWAEAGHEDREWAEAASVFLCGAIVSVDVIDVDDPECPIRSDLWDPVEVFPQFGGRSGMRRCVRVYRDTLANVVGDYRVSGEALEDLRTSTDATGAATTVDWDTVDEYIDYWDEKWHAVYRRDGKVVLAPAAHDYWFCPVTYQRGSLGRSSHRRGVQVDKRVRYTEADGSTAWGIASLEESDDMADVGEGWITSRATPHLQREAVATKEYNLLGRLDDPAWLMTQGPISRANDRLSKIRRARGIVNRVSADARLTPLLDPPNPAPFAGLKAGMAADQARQDPPLAMHGATTTSQATGNALVTEERAGGAKFAWAADTLTLYYTRRARRWLELLRGWGHLLGEPLHRGELWVPSSRRRQDPRAEPGFLLTRKTIEAAGVDILADMNGLSAREQTEALSRGKLGMDMQVWDRFHVQDELLKLDNPLDMQRAVSEDLMGMDPDLRTAKLVLDVKARHRGPDGVLDPEIQELIDLYLAIKQRGQGGGGGGGAPAQAGMPPGMGMGGPPMPPTSAVDQLAFNPGIGLGGGRPALPAPIGPPGLGMGPPF